VLFSCNTNNNQETNVQPSTSIKQEVKVVGAMRNVMRKGELFGTIALDTINNKTNLYGLGPLEYLKGEILVVDGKCYLSRVGKNDSLVMEESYNAKAPFFVYSNVQQWSEQKLPETVTDIGQLEAYIDSLMKNDTIPFTFKIKATIDSAEIHIVNLPEGTIVHSPEEAHQNQKNYMLNNEPVMLVGFFSRKHQAIFTHHDTFMHVHLINDSKTKMGHVEKVFFNKNTATLFIGQ
jgi:acetolactate decarboxylase